jgi:hypothetical protein
LFIKKGTSFLTANLYKEAYEAFDKSYNKKNPYAAYYLSLYFLKSENLNYEKSREYLMKAKEFNTNKDPGLNSEIEKYEKIINENLEKEKIINENLSKENEKKE